MPLANQNPGYSGIQSALTDAWLLSNHMSLFTRHSPLFGAFAAAGQIKRSGYGVYIRVPLMIPDGGGPRLEPLTNSYAEISSTPTTGRDAAHYKLAHYHMDVSIDEYDLKLAGGESEQVRWRESTFQKNLKTAFNQMMNNIWENEHVAGTGGDTRGRLGSLKTYLNAGKAGTTTDAGDNVAITAQTLNAVTSESGTTAVYTVGGIPRNAAGAAHWCTPMIGIDTSAENLNLQVLSKIYSLTRCGTDHATLIVMHRDSFDRIQGLLTHMGTSGGQTYPNATRLAKMGFEALQFQGAEIITDDMVPTAGYITETTTAKGYQIFAINMNYLQLMMASKKPDSQRYESSRPLEQYKWDWYLQLVGTHLGRVHARHVNIAHS